MRHIEPDPDCEICGGLGYVVTEERVYPNEPITAPIGEKPCVCTIPNDDENEDESSEEFGESHSSGESEGADDGEDEGD